MKFNKECEIEKACSKDGTRPVLANVWFDKEKSRLVATTGAIMAIVKCESEESDTSGYVTPDALKEYRKQNRKQNRKHYVPLELNGSQKIGPVTFERPTQEKMGHFPNVDQIMIKEDAVPVITIGLYAEKLMNLAKAIGAQNGFVTLKIYGDTLAVGVSCANGEGLIMPVKARS